MFGSDVAIVGGGLIGLSLAFELARRGANVRVFERGEAVKAASWAGAGMLAPNSEGEMPPALRAICERSLAMYPQFVDDVRSAGGVDPKLHLDGIVSVYAEPDDRAAFDAAVLDLQRRTVPFAPLAVRDVRALEPALSAEVKAGLLVHGEGHVDNRRLGRALRAACVARGVAIVENVEHLRVESDARRALGVRSSAGYVPATAIVNAAGAWAGEIPGVPASSTPAMIAVKGQMLALAAPNGLVRHPVYFPGGYVVPRDDGRLLIGATVERAGFDVRTTAHGISSLLTAALRIAPSLRDFAVTETWAGIRPGTADGLPFLGATPLDGYVLATGHYRNGILLAPLTAVLVADAIEGRHDACAPFSVTRAHGTVGSGAV